MDTPRGICPFCDGTGVIRLIDQSGKTLLTDRCDKCRGAGILQNGTLPGIEPPAPPDPPKVARAKDNGQTSLF